jgi:hypothetical protein
LLSKKEVKKFVDNRQRIKGNDSGVLGRRKEGLENMGKIKLGIWEKNDPADCSKVMEDVDDEEECGKKFLEYSIRELF